MTSTLQRSPIWRWRSRATSVRTAAPAPAAPAPIGDAEAEPPVLGAEAAATLHLPADAVALLVDRDLRTSAGWLTAALADAMDGSAANRRAAPRAAMPTGGRAG